MDRAAALYLEHVLVPAAARAAAHATPAQPLFFAALVAVDASGETLAPRDNTADPAAVAAWLRAPAESEQRLVLLVLEPTADTAREWVAAVAAAGTAGARVLLYVAHPHPTAPFAALAVLRQAATPALEVRDAGTDAAAAVAERLRAYLHWARSGYRVPYVTAVLYTDAERRCMDASGAAAASAFERFWTDVAAQAALLVVPPDAALSSSDQERLMLVRERQGRAGSVPVVTPAEYTHHAGAAVSPMLVVYLQVTSAQRAQYALPAVCDVWYWQEPCLLVAGSGDEREDLGTVFGGDDSGRALTLHMAFDEETTGALVVCYSSC